MTSEMSDQEKSTEWSNTILKNDKWCILDTETTGLSNNAEVIQIGLLTSSQEYQTLVKPTIAISEAASEIHGIYDRDVVQALPFEQIFLDVWKFLSDKDVIIYNSEFDLKVIRNSLKARGIQIAFPNSDRRNCRIFTNGGSIHCAMHYYSQYVGEWNEYHGNYKWQKLPGGDHSALGDCKATLEVIKQMSDAPF
ncbi:3'-5' exonuclease [Nostoc sp. NMS8]|uniref:3'-5' exonuclease n=1 Tax=Nostoc sp. NMS8 TaxID=2815392 RepID=UPI0025D00A89|nr:3'-5' exonuclease [Nostoc sp. NMS8]MBN3957487.1 3'-5' exonuclease [Nostoc sp. NMS8]